MIVSCNFNLISHSLAHTQFYVFLNCVFISFSHFAHFFSCASLCFAFFALRKLRPIYTRIESAWRSRVVECVQQHETNDNQDDREKFMVTKENVEIDQQQRVDHVMNTSQFSGRKFISSNFFVCDFLRNENSISSRLKSSFWFCWLTLTSSTTNLSSKIVLWFVCRCGWLTHPLTNSSLLKIEYPLGNITEKTTKLYNEKDYPF